MATGHWAAKGKKKMKKSFLLVLFVMFSSFIFAQTKIIKSDKGTAQFENKDVWINVVLVNDLKSTIAAWNSTSENDAPGIRSTAKISLENSFIAPFIVYKINSDKISAIYYDCELVKPDGTTSKYKGNQLVFWKHKPENKNLIYSVAQNYGWGLDETDSEGEYIIRIKVYNDTEQITEFQLAVTF